MGPLNPEESKELFLIAFEEFRGNISQACQAIGLSRSTYYFWMEEDDSFRDRVRQSRLLTIEGRLDKAEAMLDKNINRGLSADIKFFLQSHGGPRGYGKRQQVTHELGESFRGLSYPDEPATLDEWEALRDAREQGEQDASPQGEQDIPSQEPGNQAADPHAHAHKEARARARVAKTVPNDPPAGQEGGPAKAAPRGGEESLNQKPVDPIPEESLTVGDDND